MKTDGQALPLVMAHRRRGMMSIVLNRPAAINSLNLAMVRLVASRFREAMEDDACRFVLLAGTGERGFCAGGDIKELAAAAKAGDLERVERFFLEEYALDLMIHRAPKPVAAVADGVTMGGGLGLAAGADIVVATERTVMAMPETRIGFIPDIGATGWMFAKCPPGYPEFLGLTGYEMRGAECVRLGFATHLVDSARTAELIGRIEGFRAAAGGRREAARLLAREISEFATGDIPSNPGMDSWVREYFAGKSSLPDIMRSLRACSAHHGLCEGVFQRLSERSPTAVVLTLLLLRQNEGRPLEEVFDRERKAALYITRHHDYLEGVRARVLDRDDRPRWLPGSVEEVRLDGLAL